MTFPVRLLVFICVLAPGSVLTASPTELPRLTISDIVFEGAFRVPASTFGGSEMNFSEGPIEFNPDNNSVFLVGHAHQQAIAEFSVPSLVKSSSVEDLEMSSAPLQVFSSVLNRVGGGNTQNINRIGGMQYIDSGSHKGALLVHGYEYYDAAGDNSHATLVLRDANDLAGSEVDGFYEFTVDPGHVAGWISPVPAVWQESLGGTFITGMSSGIPIISRTSVGPSAFAFNPNDLLGQPEPDTAVSVVRLMDFSLGNPLHADLSNSSGENNLWTHLSRVVYGLIVPGTRTYLTIGYSAGHESGVCYKCTQTDGSGCGGYCAPDPDDYYHYYWLWDVNDFLKVRNGEIEAHEVRPYAYGLFPTPFQTNELGGGTYDPESGRLYLTVQRADRNQGTYANPPVLVAYSFAIGSGSDEQRGRLGKFLGRTVWCVKQGESFYARIDRRNASGTLKPVRKGVRFFRKKLRWQEPGSSKFKRLRRALRRARSCVRGNFFE